MVEQEKGTYRVQVVVEVEVQPDHDSHSGARNLAYDTVHAAVKDLPEFYSAYTNLATSTVHRLTEEEVLRRAIEKRDAKD